jgi:hypothetical protein
VHAAVVKFDPLIAITRPAVRVVVASAATKKELSCSTTKGTGEHSPAGVIGNRVQPISVVLISEGGVRREVGREINLAKRNIDKSIQAASHIVLINTKTLEVHNENVRRSPQVHLLGCFHILFAVRASALQKLKMKQSKAAEQQRVHIPPLIGASELLLLHIRLEQVLERCRCGGLFRTVVRFCVFWDQWPQLWRRNIGEGPIQSERQRPFNLKQKE